MSDRERERDRRRARGFDELAAGVISAGLCTGCGTCVGVCPESAIEFDYEKEEPYLGGECKKCRVCNAVCAGRDVPLPELETMVFSRPRQQSESHTGIYRRYVRAHAVDPAVRQAGASGGVVSALLIFALESGLIEGAAVAGMSAAEPWRAVPVLATTKSAVLENARSKYTLVPNNVVLREATRRGFKAIGAVGLPCHIHALRKLQKSGKPEAAAALTRFTIGLFCGANFSHEITEYAIARYTGIPLDRVAKCEYRGGPQSQDYIITAKDGTKKLISPWAFGRTIMRTRRDRCQVCVDFSAELADVSVGDIFTRAPNVAKIPRTSAVLVRTAAGEALVAAAEQAGYIVTETLDIGTFEDNGGLTEKKYYAPYYLRERRRHGWPVPDYGVDIPFEMPPFVPPLP